MDGVSMDEVANSAVLAFPATATTTGPSTTAPPTAADPLWRELVGQVLRSERVETRRTLQQVADRAGVSPQYLSEVERGRKDPSSEMLESICGALGLRLGDLLAASGRMLRCAPPAGRLTAAAQLRTGIGRTAGIGVVSLAA
jgi:DNA-binding XRE family transcriptional regulator